jgi:hypothetical protein
MIFEGKQHILYNLPVVVLGVGESLYRVPGQSSCQPLTLGCISLESFAITSEMKIHEVHEISRDCEMRTFGLWFFLPFLWYPQYPQCPLSQGASMICWIVSCGRPCICLAEKKQRTFMKLSLRLPGWQLSISIPEAFRQGHSSPRAVSQLHAQFYALRENHVFSCLQSTR